MAQLVARIGMHNVYGLAARHAIVFADKDRYTYYAPFTLDDIDESMPAWAYMPVVTDTHYSHGNVTMWKVDDDFWVIYDGRSNYLHASRTEAFDMAGWLAHNSKRLPAIVAHPTEVSVGGAESGGALIDDTFDATRGEWYNQTKQGQIVIPLSRSDAVAIVNGTRPSFEFMSTLATRFGVSVIGDYGLPLITISDTKHALGLRKTIRSIATDNHVDYEGTLHRVANRDFAIGGETIVGGWAFPSIAGEYRHTPATLAMMDLALDAFPHPSVLSYLTGPGYLSDPA